MSDVYDQESKTETQAVKFEALHLDATAYLPFLEAEDWSEEQKQEFIQALWQIIVGFADMGFGLCPIEHVTDFTKTLEVDSLKVLSSEDNSQNNSSLLVVPFGIAEERDS